MVCAQNCIANKLGVPLKKLIYSSGDANNCRSIDTLYVSNGDMTNVPATWVKLFEIPLTNLQVCLDNAGGELTGLYLRTYSSSYGWRAWKRVTLTSLT